MSLSDIPWNHLHLPTRQDSATGLYPQNLYPPAFLAHGFSQLSNAFYHNHLNSFNMNPLSTDEMERFQKLSNEFEPDIQVSITPNRRLCSD